MNSKIENLILKNNKEYGKSFLLWILINALLSISLVYYFRISSSIIFFLFIITFIFYKPELIWGLMIFGSKLISAMFDEFYSNLHFNIGIVLALIITFYIFKNLISVRINLTKDFYLVALFFSYLIFSYMISSDKEYGFLKLKYFIIFIPFLISSFIIFKNKPDAILMILNSGFIIGIIYILITVLYSNEYYGERISILNINPIWYSRHLGMFCIIGLFLGRLSYETYKKAFYYSFSILMFIYMFKSGSRAPILALMCSIILAYIILQLKKRKVNFKFLIKLAFVVLILFLAVIIIINYLSEDLKLRITSQSRSSKISGFIRIFLAIDSFQLFKNNPLFGVGLGGFTQSTMGRFRYPHNIFLELISETGLIGLILFSTILVRCFLNSIKLLKNHNMKTTGFEFTVFLVILSSYTMINAQFSGDIASNAYIWFSIGGLLVLSSWNRNVLKA